MSKSKSILVLANGQSFLGESIGAKGTKFGEFVFNTAMTGYQEILTDPSYKGQFVVMTYPHIGNYGINSEDFESKRIFLEGFVAKEFSPIVSNYRATLSLNEFLINNDVIGISNIDTRALTKMIREEGSMMGAISNTEFDVDKLLAQIAEHPSTVGIDLVKEVTTEKIYQWNKEKNLPKSIHESNQYYDGLHSLHSEKAGYHIVVLDCGVKYNMLKLLSLLGNKVTIVPANTDFSEIQKLKPDGILVSNGPGDPSAVPYLVNTVKQIIKNSIPTMGICFGHQLIGQALGGKTYKLKFGHHGANHPVKDLATGKVEITSQNHNFCVDYDSLNKNEIEITHINLNDNTVEGLKHKIKPVFSLQYHPESSPGPNDSRYLFKRFLNKIGEIKNA